MASPIPDRVFSELVEYASRAVLGDQEVRVRTGREGYADEEGRRDENVIAHEKSPSPILDTREKARYRLIGGELFSGGQKRLEELQEMIRFRDKMGRKFTSAVNLVANVPKNIGGFTVNLAESFARVMVMAQAAKAAIDIIQITVPQVYSTLDYYVFTPLVPQFIKDYANSAKWLVERAKKNIKERFDASSIKGELEDSFIGSLNREIKATMDSVESELVAFYRKYETAITVTIEMLSWGSMGVFVGSFFGPWGSLIGGAVGALAGLAIALVELDAKEKTRSGLFEEARRVAGFNTTMRKRYDEAIGEIDAELARLKENDKTSLREILKKRAAAQELVEKKRKLVEKRWRSWFSSGEVVQRTFFYGEGGPPEVVQLLESLGYKENIDYRLEVTGEGENRKMYLKDFMGVPLNLTGDNVDLLKRLQEEVWKQYRTIMQGTAFQDDFRELERYIEGSVEYKPGSFEERVVFDGEGNIRTQVKLIADFRGRYDHRLEMMKEGIEADLGKTEDFKPLTRREREMLAEDEKRFREVREALESGKGRLWGERDVSREYAAALDFYERNIPREAVAEMAKLLYGAYREVLSAMAAPPALQYRVQGEDSMLNIVYKKTMGDTSAPWQKKWTLHFAATTKKSSKAIISALKGKKPKRPRKETPETARATPPPPEPSINVAVVPYSMVVITGKTEVLYNTEAEDIQNSFSQSGHMVSRNADRDDFGVLNS